MELKSLVGALSTERLTGYQRTGRSETAEHTLQRYLWNIQLCEALYPVLNLLEVTLRNTLHSALWQHTGHEDWYASFFLTNAKRWRFKTPLICSSEIGSRLRLARWWRK